MAARTRTIILFGTVVGGLALACVGGTSRSVGPTVPPPDTTAGHVHHDSAPALFVCKNNGGPYADSAVIGTNGGVLHLGPHWLLIPQGALTANTTISGHAYAGDTLAIAFQPQGLQFRTAALLVLDFHHCQAQPLDSLVIQYVNDSLTSVLATVPAPSTDDDGHQEHYPGAVFGSITHFSVYAGSETRKKPPR